MILRFVSGTKNRLMIDTEEKTYNDEYFFIGGWDHCMELSRLDFKDLKERVRLEFVYVPSGDYRN